MARDACDVLAMFATECRDEAAVMMGSPSFGTAAAPPSACFRSVPSYEIHSPHHTLYYAAYPHFGYQTQCRSSEDVADLTVLPTSDLRYPALEYWRFGTRTCHNKELLLNLEIVRPLFN